MIGSSIPLCYPQIGTSNLLWSRALCLVRPLRKHIRPPTSIGVVMVGLLLRSVRVFRQVAWLEVGSGKMALSRPTHQYPEGA